jgi:hypothetical protein
VTVATIHCGWSLRPGTVPDNERRPAMAKEPNTRRTFREVWPTWREGVFIAGSLLISAAVAGVTGWGSWGHIVHIGRSVGEPSADWLPVAIDGMMFNGTILVAVDRFRKRVARPWAVISLWLGSVLTLAFNIASAWERGVWAMLIAVTYSVALLCTVEAVFHPSQTLIEEAMARKVAKREAQAASKARAMVAPTVPVAVVVPAVAPETVPDVVAEVPQPEPVNDDEPAKPPRRRRPPRTTLGKGVKRADDATTTDVTVDAVIEPVSVPIG